MCLRKGLSLGLLFALLLMSTPSGIAAGESAATPEIYTTDSAGSFPEAMLRAVLDWTLAQGVPGVVLGVATPRGVWIGASGTANLKSGEPMSAGHQIRLASITKPFTAALIWSLIEEGVLSLEDPVNKWLAPGRVPKGNVITIGMLLNHTSGLYDHENSQEFGEKFLADPTHVWTAKEVLAITRSYPLDFTPGTDCSYSNTGYYVLGLIAEAATGRTVNELTTERLFKPLGMNRTTLTRAGRLSTPRTPGYVYLDGHSQPLSVLKWNFSWDWTAGAGVSTAYDMLTWASGLSNGTVLKKETLDEAWTVKAPSRYGYGFEVGKSVFGDRKIGHTGMNTGTTTDWLFYPDKGWALFTGLNLSDYRSQPQIKTAVILLGIRNMVEAAMGWNVSASREAGAQ